MADWNRNIVDEFRANEGLVGGPFEGKTMLLLNHKGAKSGTERGNPVMYETLGIDFAIFASKNGADSNPDWLYNLKANPETTVEIGTETIPVRARVAPLEEREPIWTKWKQANSNFADYELKTTRQIPVVILERR